MAHSYVYVLSYGENSEGSSPLGVFWNLADAKKEGDKVIDNAPFQGQWTEKWSNERNKVWMRSGGCDYCMIQKMKVQ